MKGNGIGLGTLLFLIFMMLKLCGVIDWSWWWVTSPLWIAAGLIVFIFLVVGVLYAIARR